ncbi:MAG: 4Fe-4S binding protein [Desulfobacterales bacterium]|nr:4Fe-4S binding protein [Desulfobacterales bacterium]
MTSTIYDKVADKLNEYSYGFARTESGVEIKLLKKLFTEEEAAMFLHLSRDLQTAEEVALKINRDSAEVEETLQHMLKKGQIYARFPKKEGEPPYYLAAPWCLGIEENQLLRVDKEWAELVEEYHSRPNLYITKVDLPFPIRNIPIHSALKSTVAVAPYDDIRKVIQRKDRISVADCICNKLRTTNGGKCDQPKEVCLMFDFYADYYVETGMGRFISKEEAMRLLDMVEEAGLVPQASNTEDPEFICNCCPNCCDALIALKKMPSPGLVVSSNYFSMVDTELCSGCGNCVERCPMDAIALSGDDVAEIHVDRCIGCGLCVRECPVEALRLVRKADDKIQVPAEVSAFVRSSRELEAQVKKS